jgi:hypothetical protein
MASVVAVRKYDLYGRAFVAAVPLRALGEGRVGVGGGDLDELGVVEDLLHGLGDRGVQRADDAEDVLVGDQLGGVLLARGGLRLVVEGLDLEGDPVDGLLLVGRLGGEVHGVLDAEAQRGEVAGQRGVDADDDGGATAVGVRTAAVLVARAAGGEGECSRRQRGGDGDERTLTHDQQSFPWHGRSSWSGPSRALGRK